MSASDNTKPQSQADQGEAQALSQHQTQDLNALRTQGHAYPDFTRSLARGVGDYAVNTNCGENQSRRKFKPDLIQVSRHRVCGPVLATDCTLRCCIWHCMAENVMLVTGLVSLQHRGRAIERLRQRL